MAAEVDTGRHTPYTGLCHESVDRKICRRQPRHISLGAPLPASFGRNPATVGRQSYVAVDGGGAIVDGTFDSHQFGNIEFGGGRRGEEFGFHTVQSARFAVDSQLAGHSVEIGDVPDTAADSEFQKPRISGVEAPQRHVGHCSGHVGAQAELIRSGKRPDSRAESRESPDNIAEPYPGVGFQAQRHCRHVGAFGQPHVGVETYGRGVGKYSESRGRDLSVGHIEPARGIDAQAAALFGEQAPQRKADRRPPVAERVDIDSHIARPEIVHVESRSRSGAADGVEQIGGGQSQGIGRDSPHKRIGGRRRLRRNSHRMSLKPRRRRREIGGGHAVDPQQPGVDTSAPQIDEPIAETRRGHRGPKSIDCRQHSHRVVNTPQLNVARTDDHRELRGGCVGIDGRVGTHGKVYARSVEQRPVEIDSFEIHLQARRLHLEVVDRRTEPHKRIGVPELIAGTVEARIVDLDIAPEKRSQPYTEVKALRHEHSVACLFYDESVVDTQPQRPAKPYAFNRDVIAGSLRHLSDSNILDKVLNKRHVATTIPSHLAIFRTILIADS